jgi:serine protease Do
MGRSIALLLTGGLAGATLTLAPAIGREVGTETVGAVVPGEPLEPPIATPKASPPQADTYDPSRSFAPLVKAVEPAVVAIEVEGTAQAPDMSQLPPEFRQFLGADPRQFGPRPLHGEGSGFIVSADGLLLTNHHVIDGADQISARFADGTVVKATVIGSDPSIDVALLQLEGDRQWPFVQLGDSSTLEVGDWVIAVGNPLGLGTTVTSGIVSGKGRALGHGVWDDFLQTDAAINEGNSGGPLFDLDGRVVGINTAIIAGANTIGFAIPIDMVEDVIEDLRDHGKVARGYIGVRPSDDEGKGAIVAQVYDDTPAEKAGLLPGDRILDVDGREIADPVALVKTIGSLDPGEEVTLHIERDGKPQDLVVTLGERPSEDPTAAAPAPSGEGAADPESLGLDLRDVTAKEASRLGIPAGVEVENVTKGSAAEGFLRPGDVILEINHWPVATTADVDDLLARSSGAALLLVQRGDARRYVQLRLP